MLRNVRVNAVVTQAAASKGYMNATELADYLVRKGIPFREAHELVGRIVLHAIERGVELEALKLAELQAFSERIAADVFEALSLDNTLGTKTQVGGTSPEQVLKALLAARASIDKTDLSG